MAPVLQITDLSTHIQLTKSVVQAVGNVDLTIEPGEALGLVGESGCGKSMTGLSIMGLLPPGGAIVGGSIKLDGRELVGLSDAELRKIRGNDIAMIFQDPLTSLDPTKTIGYQVAEPVRLHTRREQGGRHGPGDRGARAGRPAAAGRAARRLPASALRRAAPARDDRHGAELRAQAADRRRADHRAGRHHPGADPRPAARPQGPPRDGDAPDHARHGRDRRARGPGPGDVRGPDGRGGRDREPVRAHAPPVHLRAARLHPAPEPGQHEAAAHHRRAAAGSRAAAARLPVRATVQPGHRQMPHRRAAAHRRDPGPPVLLLAPGGRPGR